MVFILVAKISYKKSLSENGKQLDDGTDLTSVYKKHWLLRSVGRAFDSKLISFRRMRKKNLIILKIININKLIQ